MKSPKVYPGIYRLSSVNVFFLPSSWGSSSQTQPELPFQDRNLTISLHLKNIDGLLLLKWWSSNWHGRVFTNWLQSILLFLSVLTLHLTSHCNHRKLFINVKLAHLSAAFAHAVPSVSNEGNVSLPYLMNFLYFITGLPSHPSVYLHNFFT